MSPTPSLVSGPKTPALWEETLGELVYRQALRYGDHTAAIFSWQQNHKLSFGDLGLRSEAVAKALLARGLVHGHKIAIMAGNCYQYIEVFLAAARIGCPLIVLNNTYSAREMITALKVTSCQLLFLAPKIKLKDLSAHIKAVGLELSSLLCILLSTKSGTAETPGTAATSRVGYYSSFVLEGQKASTTELVQAERRVRNSDILNLQFTSGTTGAPKAAMLSHRNLINNARFCGAEMNLTPVDIVCCPPPLFHCFGLVMGFLGAFTHGAQIIFPSDQFDPDEVLDTLHEHQCTALLGVPTMFIAEIEANKVKKYEISSVRTGLAAGSSVAPSLMTQLEREFGVKGMLIAYGMTETSPITFMTSLQDGAERRATTVGTVLPHTVAKVIDRQGSILPRGKRGELCTSGYALQTGYYNNPAKTNDAMIRDETGVLWMHTGDEGMIDEEGYCSVTGRIKDMIIRGGENIFPYEIEALLATHPSIAEASVVAIRDEKYGEVVGAFLRAHPQVVRLTPNNNPSSMDLADRNKLQDKGLNRPNWGEINSFVRKSLGSHKSPRYVFWMGDPDVPAEWPKTGSGKIMKHVLRDTGEKLVLEGRGGKEEGLPEVEAKAKL